MQGNDALRDRQPEAVAVYRSAVGAAVERREDGLQFRFRHARAAVRHADAVARSRRLRRELDRHPPTFRRMLERVAHDVFERAMQQFGVAPDRERRRLRRGIVDAAGGGLRLEARVLDQRIEQFAQIDRFVQPSGHARLETRQRQQFADQPFHAHRFALDAREQIGAAFRLLAQQADGRLQAGERRAQFVRDVVQEAPLAVHQGLKARRHAVEIAPEIGQLVAPAAHFQRQPLPQATVGGPRESGAQAADRLGEIPGEQRREEQADERPGKQRNRWERQGRARRRSRVAVVRMRRRTGRCERRRSGRPGLGGRRREEHVGASVGGDRPRDAAPHRPGRPLGRRRRAGQPKDARLRFGCDGAPEQLPPLLVEREHRRPRQAALFVEQRAQGGDAAVAQRGSRGVDVEDGRRAEVDAGRRPLVRTVLQPEGQPDAETGGQLGQPEKEEEFPEKTPHAYSRTYW